LERSLYEIIRQKDRGGKRFGGGPLEDAPFLLSSCGWEMGKEGGGGGVLYSVTPKDTKNCPLKIELRAGGGKNQKKKALSSQILNQEGKTCKINRRRIPAGNRTCEGIRGEKGFGRRGKSRGNLKNLNHERKIVPVGKKERPWICNEGKVGT